MRSEGTTPASLGILEQVALSGGLYALEDVLVILVRGEDYNGGLGQ